MYSLPLTQPEDGAYGTSHPHPKTQHGLKMVLGGIPGWLSGLAPAFGPGRDVILESQDGVLHQAPCVEPASPSACISVSLCVSLMNK